MITDFCDKELLDERISEACKNEIIKTKNRIN